MDGSVLNYLYYAALTNVRILGHHMCIPALEVFLSFLLALIHNFYESLFRPMGPSIMTFNFLKETQPQMKTLNRSAIS